MRDFRNDQVIDMAPLLLDLLTVIHGRPGGSEPIGVMSAYRSPETNNMLLASGTGVAKNSYHMYGQAIDIRLSDRTPREIHRVALSLEAGGVSRYGGSNFVHIDTCPVRTW